MKKRGTTKATAKDKDHNTVATEQDASKTGDKRQLPLDFSRHAIVNSNAKKASTSRENATKNSSTLPNELGSPSASNSFFSCTLEPPVIRVNLVASKTPGSSIDKETECFDATAVVAAVSHRRISDDDREINDEDDDDSLLRIKTSIRASSDIDCEDEESSEVKTEDIMDSTLSDALKIKLEPDNEDKKDPDILLPSQFRWKTVYVAAFELALDTVLPEEAFLFTDEEHSLFETYRALEDDPKHLFVRLFLRNQKYWQRQSKLEGRYREIEDLDSAIQQLITMGLLMDKSMIQDPKEALVVLTMDELKILARRIGVMEKLSGKQRHLLVAAILEHFRQQSFISKRLLLAPGGAANGGSERKSGLATHVFSGDASKRDNALIDKIMDISGPSIKIYPNIMRVFERLHLVFYRTREYSERPALIEAILAKIGQRTFPSYDITRSSIVFRNREELLKYEAAIKLHFDLSEMIESAMGPGRGATIYVRDGDQDNMNSGSGANSKTNRRPSAFKSTSKKSSDPKAENNSIESKLDQEEKDPEQERRRLEVVRIYEKVIQEAEGIRGTWREYLATETELSKKNPNYFMMRFSPGWVYTQILRLELRAFAFLKRFEEESILLHELLDQHIYSLGQRGGWYERLALIKSNYAFQKRLGKQEALQVCMMALRDKHVHAVDATLIQARIVRLESELKVPFRDRHDFSYLTLRKAQTRILTGERLNTPGTAAPSYASSHSYSYVPNSMGSSSHPIAQQRPLWRNIDGSDCCVEELALSYYGTLGYKGYHSENSILTTLFGLLFWDILFSPQPGVFETSFQTEPLDLRTDAFFLQRQDMIMDRIDSISKSKITSDNELETCLIGLPQKSYKVAVKEALEKGRPTVSENQENDEDEVDEPLINQRRQQKIQPTSYPKPVNQELLGNVLFEEEITQELGQDEDQYSEERQAEILREELLAKKRKECFYLDVLQKHDDLYREKKTFCVGVNWTFTKEELLQIAECIGGPALSEICKVLAQEYSKRCSGMPDLCCWDYKKKLVKFVEVKGPGDRLSSKQQVWIDLLSSLGVDIELCIVQISKDEDAYLEERNALN
ncbi:hypothetical protein BGX27_004359 [Mortierella sp. AM989]|nr:hypothetical protein BGX27_004359 [Mortierella sp. AM989]